MIICNFDIKFKVIIILAKSQIIGREHEQQILGDIYADGDARLVAIYGRRRVGKTFLVKNFFEGKLDF